MGRSSRLWSFVSAFPLPLASALLLGAVSVGNAGCDGGSRSGPVVEVEHEGSLVPTWQEFLQGATLTTPGGTVYRIDGDEFTSSEADLHEYYDSMLSADEVPKLATFRRITTGFEPVFVPGASVNIKYCVSDQFVNYSPFSKAPMITAMQSAGAAWMATSNIRFIYVSSQDSNCTNTNAAVDFALVPSTFPQYSGCAANKMMWGNNGCPVSGPFNDPSAKGVLAVNLPGLQPFVSTQGLLMHELGHMIGFRHEHPFGPNGCGGGEPQNDTTADVGFRRLTAYDQSSVMNYPGFCGKPNVDFAISALDTQGSRLVYGIPASWYINSVPL